MEVGEGSCLASSSVTDSLDVGGFDTCLAELHTSTSMCLSVPIRKI